MATLILEHACLLYSSSEPTLSDALDAAYHQYQASSVDALIIREFPTLQEISIPQSTTFILNNRLPSQV